MQKITNDLKFSTGGILEFMVLKMISTLPHSAQEIFKELKLAGFKTPLGSLYPLLSKFRRNNYLIYGYEESDEGFVYKTFELTAKGKERLAILRNDWKNLNSLINSL